jgi:hypothetical protein
MLSGPRRAVNEASGPLERNFDGEASIACLTEDPYY